MNEKLVFLEVNFFKPHGKWYMEEALEMPYHFLLGETNFYETRKWIIENRPYKDEFIMAITDDKAMDYIGYPMLDLTTTMKEEK